MTTTFEIDYDGNIHYEDYQQQMYNTCWQDAVDDSKNATNVYCICATKYRKMNKSKKKKHLFVNASPRKQQNEIKHNFT
jgi:hypothetical protein